MNIGSNPEPKTITISICWNCKNGRADRCGWIKNKKQVWEKAVEKECSKDVNIWVVQECKRYDPENPYWQQGVSKSQPKPQKKKVSHRRRLYTPKDDALLLELREQGIPCGEIARRMDRTIYSIYKRIARLKEMGVEREDDKVYATIGK